MTYRQFIAQLIAEIGSSQALLDDHLRRVRRLCERLGELKLLDKVMDHEPLSKG